MTELSGRTVSYGYDSIYRLTSETIASDPNSVNGAASYVYDAVGNRTQKTSTIPGFPGGLTNYNANDQLATDTYDNDGNTTASNGVGYVYDFENHVIQAGAGITMVYDGDGNRVSKTVAGVTTKYLVDPQNPTGYAQVVQENSSGSFSANRELSRVFVYGLERISQLRSYVVSGQSQTQTQISYYAYDGHGSTRALTDPNGAVTDTYDYDAFGNIVHSTATGIPPGGTTVTATPNEFLFAGEQFDSDLNLYYSRARYLNVSTGRFWTMDTYQGDGESPLSLHKYLYSDGSPVDRIDPSGNFGLDDVLIAVTLSIVVFSMSSCTQPGPQPFATVKQIAYDRMENGIFILLGAYTKSSIPKFPEFNWVQYVTTNAIDPNLKGKGVEFPDVPFIDPPRPPGYPPYYYAANERGLIPKYGDYDICFEDAPYKPPSNYPEVKGQIYWRAELFLVGVNPAGSSSYTKLVRITYGFTIEQNGGIPMEPLIIQRLIAD